MKNRKALLLMFFIITISLNCRLFEDSDNPNNKGCGALTVWSDEVIDNYSTLVRQANSIEIYYENANAPFNICADKSSIVNFKIQLKGDTLPRGIQSVYGRIYWGLSDQQDVFLKFDAAKKALTGKATPNLKPFFGDAPAWVGMTIIFRTPAGIEDAQARSIVEQSGISAETSLTYYEF